MDNFEKLKYLTFLCDGLNLAAPVTYVSEIIVSDTLITRVPRVPSYVEGIMNLRGRIIPVINTRLLLNRDISITEENEEKSSTCIIIIQVEDEYAGLLVDSVKQIFDVEKENLSAIPTGQNENKYLTEIVKIGNDVNFVLDCNLLNL